MGIPSVTLHGLRVPAPLELSREVEALFDTIARLGVDVGRERALDFGCGVGRVTQALCEYFTECTGIDIAPAVRPP